MVNQWALAAVALVVAAPFVAFGIISWRNQRRVKRLFTRRKQPILFDDAAD